MIHLIGTGGHGKVVLDALLASGADLSDIVARDGAVEREGLSWLGLKVAVPEAVAALSGQAFHVAVGSGAARERLTDAANQMGGRAATIVHPAATISRFAEVGAGAFLAATCVVGPDARLGLGVIVNHGAVVDHDCEVADFAHLAPNCALGGGVRVGARALIGAGAVVLPGLTVDADAIVGAGAVVTRNVLAGQTWTGVPASLKDSA